MDFLRNVIGVGSAQLGSQASAEPNFSDFGDGRREDGHVTYGYAAVQGRRGGMEDCVTAQIFHVQFKRCANGEVYGFFGVFDGHGGAMAANFVKDNLFVNLEKHEKFPDDMDAALKATFQQTDQDYLQLCTMEGYDDGCTGVTAIVYGRQLWIAHVGDSRAVLCPSTGNAFPLSEDHKPSRNDEHDRIESDGGAVIWAGTWRVSGVLAVSRAFGDRALKKFVISLPDVRHDAMAGGEEYVVLASDGLWDVIANRECAEIVRKQKDKVKAAARALSDEALHRGSMDNVSCVVIRFAPGP